LVSNGYQEIVLTGIHTGGYGSDLEDYSLFDLLSELSLITDLNRIRISSIEINELTDDILQLIASNQKFAKHLHIPLQSGSDDVLIRMRRKYNKQDFMDKIKHIRSLIPDIAITTDVIVGFPGETDEMFNEMYEFIKKIEFSEMHVFPYSMRSGTKAADMKNQINGIVKSFRVNELINLSGLLASRYIEKFDKLSVIFETSDKDFTYGHSENYVYVKTLRDESLHNTMVDVKLITHTYKNCLCEVVK